MSMWKASVLIGLPVGSKDKWECIDGPSAESLGEQNEMIRAMTDSGGEINGKKYSHAQILSPRGRGKRRRFDQASAVEDDSGDEPNDQPKAKKAKAKDA